MGELTASVSASDSGPVVMLSGDADLRAAADLGKVLDAQMEDESIASVTLDISGLRFIDSTAVRLLVLAGRALHERGGTLVLVRPQHRVARVLEMMGVGEFISIQGVTEHEPGRDTADRSK